MARLGHALAALHPGRRLRIAVDGVDGAGKTMFGAALVTRIRGSGRSAVAATVDRFHRPPARRYARGRHSPVGFYRNSFDHERLRRMASRNGCPADPEHPANARYRHGQQLYLDECSPAARADVLLDNSDPRRPRLLRWPQRWG